MGRANAKIADIETSYGPGGPGHLPVATVQYGSRPWPGVGSLPIRLPAPLSCHRRHAHRGSHDRRKSRISSKITSAPAGAEVSVPKFVWNGKTKTVGGGCPFNQRRPRPCLIALLVQCVGSAGIYCQQYAHLYINAADNGSWYLRMEGKESKGGEFELELRRRCKIKVSEFMVRTAGYTTAFCLRRVSFLSITEQLQFFLQ